MFQKAQALYLPISKKFSVLGYNKKAKLEIGKLENLAGLIIGGFNIKPDDPGEEFGRNLQEIVLGAVQDSTYPVCFDFPVGHQKVNYALKCGALHRLMVQQEQVTLEEIN